MRGTPCLHSIPFYLVAFIMLLTSCEQNAVYEKSMSISGYKWSYDTIPAFQIQIDDAQSTYDIYVNLRHNKDYKFSNFFFLLHQNGPGLKDTAYRHEVKLAELDGRWLGKSAGSLYHIEYWARQGFVFPDTGVYTFSLEQNMRSSPLEGVTDVGVKVVKKP